MSPVLRFAIFLRKVINCGKQLGVAMRLRAQGPDFPRFTKPFGTTCLPHILRRISVAIRRALLMEEQAMKQAGIIPPPPVRNRTPSSGEPRARRQDAAPPGSQRTARPAAPLADPHYAGYPSAKELAAEFLRRPIAEVLADICRDLGITPQHPLWPEMCDFIADHGGSVTALEQDAGERWCSWRWLEIPFIHPPYETLTFWPAPWSDPVTAAAATGPPDVTGPS
jgi:hypothetical protein